MQYRFEWDPKKAAANAAKHGVLFEHAAMVFKDPNHRSVFDAEHSEVEDRWFTLGLGSTGALMVVHHTFAQLDAHTAIIRLISARKATKREQQQYAE